MPRIVEIILPQIQNVPVQITQEFENVLIIGDDRIFWTVISIKPDNSILKREHFNYPFSDLASTETTGEVFVEEISSALWAKTDEILAMPETTTEEISLKSARYGKSFAYKIEGE